jgi:hypothetical protein
MALILALMATSAFSQDDAARQAYLQKRAEEKAAAERAVKELSARDYGTLTADEFIRLAYAYNELGDNLLALDAVCRVPDDVLAKKKQLDLKAICFHNVRSSEDMAAHFRELAFIDRCVDKKYDNQGVWLWRKASLLCQSSVSPAALTIGDQIGSGARVIEREQFEYSFELLERAFQVEPKLWRQAGVAQEFMWSQGFPLLCDEPRFKELMKKHAAK